MDQVVIGVVGPMASGKGVFVQRISDLGYIPYSLSNIIRDTADLLQLPHDREILQDVGDLLRRHAGNAVLAERTIGRILASTDKYNVVESIRHPDEVYALRKVFGAKIIAVDASFEKRFELINIRNRKGDPHSWEDFLIAANRDLGIGQEESGQRVRDCLRLADYTIGNEGTLDQFHSEINKVLGVIGIEGQPKQAEKR